MAPVKRGQSGLFFQKPNDWVQPEDDLKKPLNQNIHVVDPRLLLDKQLAIPLPSWANVSDSLVVPIIKADYRMHVKVMVVSVHVK